MRIGERMPLWAQVHVRGDFELSPEALAWMRSRRPLVQALMLQFPPRCLVRVGAGGDIETVIGYHAAGWLHLSSGLMAPRVRWARAEYAELVDCWRGLTPERVREVLDGGR